MASSTSTTTALTVSQLAVRCSTVFSLTEMTAPAVYFGEARRCIHHKLSDEFDELVVNIFNAVAVLPGVNTTTSTAERQRITTLQTSHIGLMLIVKTLVCFIKPRSNGKAYSGREVFKRQRKRLQRILAGDFASIKQEMLEIRQRHQQRQRVRECGTADGSLSIQELSVEQKYSAAKRAYHDGDMSKTFRILRESHRATVNMSTARPLLEELQLPRRSPAVDEGFLADAPELNYKMQDIRKVFHRQPRHKAPALDNWTPDDFRHYVAPPSTSNKDPSSIELERSEAAVKRLFNRLGNLATFVPEARQLLTAVREVALVKPTSTEDNLKIRPLGLSSTLFRHVCSVAARYGKTEVDDYCSSFGQYVFSAYGADVANTSVRLLSELMTADAAVRNGDSRHTTDDLSVSEPEPFVVLRVDYANAYNTIDRSVALREYAQLKPVLAPLAVGLYNQPRLRVALHDNDAHGQPQLYWSHEGSTQGCPFAAQLAAITQAKIMEAMMQDSELAKDVTSVFMSDDGVVHLPASKAAAWYDRFVSVSRDVGGMIVSPDKCAWWSPDEHLDLNIAGINRIPCQEGFTFNGLPFGESQFQRSALRDKIEDIRTSARAVAAYAVRSRQAAYTLYKFCVCSRSVHLERIFADILFQEDLLCLLRDTHSQALFDIIGLSSDDLDNSAIRTAQLFLPQRDAGFGIRNPLALGKAAFLGAFLSVLSADIQSTFPMFRPLVQSVRSGCPPTEIPYFAAVANCWRAMTAVSAFMQSTIVTDSIGTLSTTVDAPATTMQDETISASTALLYQLSEDHSDVKWQRVLSSFVQKDATDSVIAGLSAVGAEALASFRTSCRTVWTHATGVSGGERLNNTDFHTISALRLGWHGELLTDASQQPITQCSLNDCTATIDRYGSHLITCASGPGGRSTIHNTTLLTLLESCHRATAVGARIEVDRVVSYQGREYDVRADLYIPDAIPTGPNERNEPALVECKTRLATAARYVDAASKSVDGGASRLEEDILQGKLTMSGVARGVPYSASANAFSAELRPAVVMLPGARLGSQVLKLFRDLGSFAAARGRWPSAWRPFAARRRRLAEVAIQKAIAARIQSCASSLRRRVGCGFTGRLSRGYDAHGRLSPVHFADHYVDDAAVAGAGCLSSSCSRPVCTPVRGGGGACGSGVSVAA